MKGGFVWLDEAGKILHHFCMPLSKTNKPYEKPEVDGLAVLRMLEANSSGFKVFCERPTSYGMLPASAFHYGYNFAILSKAIEKVFSEVTYVDPHAWAKKLHIGLDKNLKAKAKSLMVFQKLYPGLQFGVNKAAAEGLIDAALIAEYGRTSQQ